MTRHDDGGGDTWVQAVPAPPTGPGGVPADPPPGAPAPPPPPPPPPPPVSAPVRARVPTERPARAPRTSGVISSLRRRGVVAGAALAVAAVAAGGVVWLRGSPSTPGPASHDRFALAAAKVHEQASFKTIMTMSAAGPHGTVTMRARGAFDVAARRGRLTMSMRGMGTMPAGMSRIESVYDFADGLVVYMKVPQLAHMLGPGVSWIKMDLQKVSEEAGFDLDALLQAGQDNPMQAVDYLYGIRDVRVAGRGRVRGVPTTRYAGVVDFDALHDELPAEAAVALDKVMELSGVERVPVEVWLGKKDGLPRRISYDYPEISSPGQPPALGKMTMDLFGYGARVNVALPEPWEVSDLFDLVNEGS